MAASLRELRFLRRYVELAGISFGVLAAQNLQHLLANGDEFIGGVNLSSQRRLLNRPLAAILELKVICVAASANRACCSCAFRDSIVLPVQTEDVRHVGNADLRRVKAIGEGARGGEGRNFGGCPRAGGRKTGRHGWIVISPLRQRVLSGN